MRRVLSLLGGPLLAALLLGGCSAAETPLPVDTALPTDPPTPSITAEPTLPPDTSSPEDIPTPEEAYKQLIVSIPPELAARCSLAPKSEEMAPGELAQADCDLPTGALANFVTYRLFDGSDSLGAYFDSQRMAHENAHTASGPGCGRGAGEGTWDAGRKDCFTTKPNEAHVMWTHDLLYIQVDAFRADGDFAKLEQFWATAGPIAP